MPVGRRDLWLMTEQLSLWECKRIQFAEIYQDNEGESVLLRASDKYIPRISRRIRIQIQFSLMFHGGYDVFLLILPRLYDTWGLTKGRPI